ncbi:hypothetical protein GEMRC1_004431 [Eukaryota sp. GEM-RC1]
MSKIERGLLLARSQNNVYEGKFKQAGVFTDVILKEYAKLESPEFASLHRCSYGDNSHPNIIKMLDIDESDVNFVYLVLEKCDMNLSQYFEAVSNGTYTFDRAVKLSLIHQLIDGLAHIHSKDVIHADLKPTNIMVNVAADQSVTIKIADFGVSHYIPADRTHIKTDNAAGTWGYQVPESNVSVFESGSRLCKRADVFSLGILVHQILTGTHPFGNTPKEQQRAIYHISSEPSLDLTKLTPVEANFIKGCLQKHVINRPFISDLQRHPLTLSACKYNQLTSTALNADHCSIGDILRHMHDLIKTKIPLISALNCYKTNIPDNWLKKIPERYALEIERTISPRNYNYTVTSIFGLLTTIRNFSSHAQLTPLLQRQTPFEFFSKYVPDFIINVAFFIKDCFDIGTTGSHGIPSLYIYPDASYVPKASQVNSTPRSSVTHQPPTATPPPRITTPPTTTPPPRITTPPTTTPPPRITTPTPTIRRPPVQPFISVVAKQRLGKPSKTKVEFSNLPNGIDCHEFALFASKFGPIKPFRVKKPFSVRPETDGSSTGFVQYASHAFARKAVDQVNQNNISWPESNQVISCRIADSDDNFYDSLPCKSNCNSLYIKFLPYSISLSDFRDFVKRIKGTFERGQPTRLFDRGTAVNSFYKTGSVWFGGNERKLREAYERINVDGLTYKGTYVSASYFYDSQL